MFFTKIIFTKNHLILLIKKFFDEMENKGILDLPVQVKHKMCQLGCACKAALYNASEAKLNTLFDEIRDLIAEDHAYDDDEYNESNDGIATADSIFLPIHRDQIRFLVKLITDEFNGKDGGRSNANGGRRNDGNSRGRGRQQLNKRNCY
jgi:hypothetical protein